MKLIYPLISFLISFSVIAQEANNLVFEPRHLDHLFEGCPTNSLCSKKVGKTRSLWIKLLKTNPSTSKLQDFLKKHGTLISSFYLKNENPKDTILLDSRCPNHNLADNKVSIAYNFIRTMNELEAQKDKLYVSKAYILSKENKVLEFPVPNGVFPVVLENGSLYYTMDIESLYYGLEVNSKGLINVTQARKIKKFPTKTSCPTQLKNHAKSLKIPNKIYSQFYCRNIWDSKGKSSATIMLGWTCL